MGASDQHGRSFLAVPPNDVHVVRNKNQKQGEEEFVFLIAQSPRQKYDFVADEDPAAGDGTGREVKGSVKAKEMPVVGPAGIESGA